MISNLIQRQVLRSYKPYQNLGQIDHCLHNHKFDDIICKPPIAIKFERHFDNLKFSWLMTRGELANKFEKILKTSTVFNPSFTKPFGTHTFYKGGGGRGGSAISKTVAPMNLKFSGVLETFLNVSEMYELFT